jgi:hypothetical protein
MIWSPELTCRCCRALHPLVSIVPYLLDSCSYCVPCHVIIHGLYLPEASIPGGCITRRT